jgi:lysine-N-methylase
MKLYAPSYYQKFRCIADRCRHSCCIGWEIDIDEQTCARYARLDTPYATDIRASMQREGDVSHFRLAAHDRCPHLNEQGLCRIILNCGEGYLCDICREHPRFYHQTARGMEMGLGMACEEAARIILTSDDYAAFVEVETLDGEADPDAFDTAERDRIDALLSDHTIPYTQRLQQLSAAYRVSPDALDDEQWRQQLASLEYLDEGHRALFGAYSSDQETPSEWSEVLERALAYFIYRHASQASHADELRAAVGFSLFCERLLASLIRATKAQELEEVVELARVISEEIEYSEENTQAIKELFL